MRILFLTSSEEDYLSDALLLGFKSLKAVECIDYPRRDVIYSDCAPKSISRVRGHGFTLYTNPLDDTHETDRFHIRPRLEQGEFDLIIVSDIWRQFGIFTQWRPYLNNRNTILLDGQDTPQVYPCAGLWWRKPYFWFLPRATFGFLYFKREWTTASKFNLWHRAFPSSLWRLLPDYKRLRKISFSIPSSKIVAAIPLKTKLLGSHIVDPEVAAKINDGKVDYAFTTEDAYYKDLQASRYGITTKRAGWDCLRHYEIAANGCVPCFKNLYQKPISCAPHGLIDGVNCIDYRNYEDLMLRLNRIDEKQYQQLALNTLAWAHQNSCQRAAKNLLNEWEAFVAKTAIS